MQKPKSRAANAAIAVALAPDGGLTEAEQRVEMLDQLVEETFVKLKAERRGGTPTAEEVDEAIRAAEGDLQRVSAALEREKARSTEKKSEIDEWKRWHSGLAPGEAESGLARLESEIGWRAKELARLTSSVGELVQRVTEAEARVDELEILQAALEGGFLEGPIEEDPRLVSVQRERDEARETLARMRRG